MKIMRSFQARLLLRSLVPFPPTPPFPLAMVPYASGSVPFAPRWLVPRNSPPSLLLPSESVNRG